MRRGSDRDAPFGVVAIRPWALNLPCEKWSGLVAGRGLVGRRLLEERQELAVAFRLE